MDETDFLTSAAVPTETVEIVGVSEQLFISRMDSIQNLLTVQIVGLALLAGCILALICTEVFKRV